MSLVVSYDTSYHSSHTFTSDQTSRLGRGNACWEKGTLTPGCNTNPPEMKPNPKLYFSPGAERLGYPWAGLEGAQEAMEAGVLP